MSVCSLLAVFAARVVHPHVIAGGTLRLRWGDRVVLSTPLANIRTVARIADHARTQPELEDGRLVLTQFTTTVVRIDLVEPVDALAPFRRRGRPDREPVSELRLHVDDPSAFVRALGEARGH